jgi:hypothetical protein
MTDPTQGDRAWRPTLEEQHCYADIEKSRFGAANNDWIKD